MQMYKPAYKSYITAVIVIQTSVFIDLSVQDDFSVIQLMPLFH